MAFFEGLRDRIRGPRRGDIEIDVYGSRLVSRGFVNAQGRLKDMRPANAEVHDLILEEFRRNFDSEGAYASGGWADLAESTVAQKQALGLDNGILVRHGRLKGAFTEKGHPDMEVTNTRNVFQLKSQVEYGKYHQTGTATMPERPQQLREQARRDIPRIYQRHIAGVL